MLMKPILSLLFYLCLLATTTAQKSTLKAEYFNGTNFEKKVTTRFENNIDKHWNDVPPVPGIDPHYCSIRWTGRLTAPETGTYTFSARVDDGIRVWVGGVLVIDNWQLNDDGQFTGQVKMREGTAYDLKVEYFNALIEGEVTLIWKLPTANNPTVVAPEHFQEKPKSTAPPATSTQVPVTQNKPTGQSPSPPKPTSTPPPTTTIAQQPEPEKPVPAPLPKDTLEKYVPKNVLFVQGKSIMLDISKPELDNLAWFLLRNSGYKLRIEGHTDIIGDMEMNKTLSEERAKVVAEYLATKGIEAERLSAVGHGSSRPLIKGNSKRGYPENRRVAFTLY
jgi:outer membrane protein OmpA-like peptidoglycan-associated protein